MNLSRQRDGRPYTHTNIADLTIVVPRSPVVKTAIEVSRSKFTMCVLKALVSAGYIRVLRGSHNDVIDESESSLNLCFAEQCACD